MPAIQVDFYLLAAEKNDISSEQADARYLLACRLIEKAYSRGHRLYVYCNSQADAETLDELLWTFKDESFIPHHIQGEGPTPPPPVQLAFTGEPQGFSDILLNLSETIPKFSFRFRRIIEIISSEEAAKEIGRLHYRDYRSQGCVLQTHQMG